MNSRDITINQLPAYTYNWLHMNEAKLPAVPVVKETEVQAEVPEEITETGGLYAEVMKDMEKAGVQVLTGNGADMDALAEAAGAKVRIYTVPEGVRVTEDAVRLHFSYADQGFCYDLKGAHEPTSDAGRINACCFVLEPDSEMTVVMDYTSEKNAGGLAAVQTKILAKKNAVLHLVQIQRLGETFTLLNDIGGYCEEGARVELIRLILTGKNTFDGCRVQLAGEKSSLGVEIGYQVRGDGHLDMNYDAYHTGRKTTSEMNISGVLRDQAFKLFRGTIDFQNGCSGAVGDELEDVLLMDSTVVNQTIPLILCAEEDVVGNHGATIGRLDEQLMFYMESRGMNREEVYEMMAKARIDAVIRKIADAKTREMLGAEAKDPEDE